MICSVRLDERMIHGQVAIKWTRHMSVDRIVIVSTSAAESKIVQQSLMMAAPPTAKVAIKAIGDAVPLICDPRMEAHRLMIITDSLEDLLTIVKQVPEIPLVNVGNYGRIVAKKSDGSQRKTYGANLYLYPEEVASLQQVIESGVKCNYQTVPDEAPQDLKRVLGI